MEMIWPLVIVGTGVMFGIKWGLILAGLLWLYNKNSQDASLSNQNAPPSEQSSSGSSRDNSRNSSNKSQTGFKGIRDVRGDGMN
ncbi:unnamed protein product [Blepharisma stoltei]|uniref:ATP synthase F0 subunit 8 n=1 Tax=Blepharisma stoltei TaxID=1481888 RepID=A0AAU9K3S1_9CILI|nr:unnamed protein product [Blepharisma stoltei]